MPNPNTLGNNDHSHEQPQNEGSDMSRRDFLRATAAGALGSLFAKVESTHAAKPMDKKEMLEKPKPITKAELQQVLEQRIHNKELAEVLAHCIRCGDDRTKEKDGSAGVFGGDGGPGISTLAAAEELLKRELTQEEVDAFVMTIEGQEYLHTDTHALGDEHHEGLLHELIQKGFAKDLDDAHRVYHEGTGNAEMDEKLIGVICCKTGCGHNAGIAKNPKMYGVREGLADSFLAASHKREFKKDQEHKTVVDPLEGEHLPRGAVLIQVEGDINAKTQIPLFEANSEAGGQLFVLHPQVAEARIRQFSENLAKVVPGLDVNALAKDATTKFNSHVGVTAKRLASGLPMFTVKFKQDGTWEISEPATIQ